ncbi:cell division protein ZipA C-terminal FtsZ-binding domain-containing protein [Inhella gelatinilytica]|uniref:Cell division protein ZipA n=1 Tax=Inhella gelatinilytica TaxID=2795030 RepID=A0A931IXM8_9BURK|nr:cell division protein ZipA C-terminal FtsZ-binding domain-containing protein [Inhella gelatinilytica]MBH9552959.1 cell division protein FtsZ [Inhella gelatinilytica]
MTFTLTQALMLTGAAVLVALLIQNWWLGRRAAPRRTEPDGPRQEPGLVSTGETLPTEAAVLDEFQSTAESAGRDSLVPDVSVPMVVRKAQAAPRRASVRLDPLIDVIAELELESPVSGDAALQHLPSSRRAGTKPLAIEGLNAESGEWELPVAGQRYGSFQAGLQMVNRAGPLGEIEFSEWVQKVQTFADGVGARADFPDMMEAVAQARELDQFASANDAQLEVGMRARGAAWTLGFLSHAAAKVGLVAGAIPGRLVLASEEEGAPPVLVLLYDPQAAMADEGEAPPLREVTLVFDVPQTPEALEPFAALQEVARHLARDLEAEVVDGGGRPLGPHGFAAIHEELGRLYRVLASRDMPAGSAVARRLFS